MIIIFMFAQFILNIYLILIINSASSMAQENQEYMPSQYSNLANTYNRSEFNSITKILKNLAFHTDFSHKYPVLKLLKAVCRKLLINEFQSIFFAYIVQINRWNVNDHIISKYSYEVRDIVCFSTQQIQYKSIILYLLLCGYTVKYYLNEDTEIYLIQIEKICPQFRNIFQIWAKQYAQSTLKISPKNLNKVYKNIFLKPQSKSIQRDYDSLVDNLLQISPAYNPEKLKNLENSKKAESELLKNKLQNANRFNYLHPNLNNILNLSMFTTSGFIVPSPHNTIENTSNLFIKKRNFSLGSSVFGLDSVGSIQDADIQDVTLGVGKVVESDVEQEQPHIKKMMKKQQTIIESPIQLSFKRVISNTSEYLLR